MIKNMVKSADSRPKPDKSAKQNQISRLKRSGAKDLEKKKTNWHNLSLQKVFKELKSSQKGLSARQVKARQKTFGRNRLLKGKSLSNLVILFNQIKSPLVYILLFAVIISAILGHLIDAGVILFAVLVNTCFGYWQEKKANRAIEHLRKIVKQTAKVLRQGRKIMVDSEELVPGEVIFLAAGDKVPADARLIEVEDLQAVEAVLTGESSPSTKRVGVIKKGAALADRENLVYQGTLIVRGKGRAIVCKTGWRTEVGRISRLLRETEEEKTPLQNQLKKFSHWLTGAVIGFSFLILTIGFLTGKDLVEMLIVAVALAVAAIPEGLLVAVTIILTIGMQRILKRRALVRKLIAAETLGGISIICTDKTGTLTEGEMQVFKIITADKQYSIDRLVNPSQLDKNQDLILKVSVLCSSATIENPDQELKKLKIIGDPTEKSLLLAAIHSGFNKEELEKEYRRRAEIPFSSERKFMATLNEHKRHRHQHIFVKGAPEKIFKFSDRVMVGGQKKPLTPKKAVELKKKYERLTDKGLRLLAVAYKTGQFNELRDELNDLVFLGFIALKDPLRSEAKDAINLCRKAGIRPVIVTGDHQKTARAIFRELGLKVDGNVVQGEDLDKWDDRELKQKVKKIDIYARVEPEHKLRIVDAWQSRGEVVAMTGDGVNDAPALKSADIGIALGGGSDVTKETADLILLDNNFSVIVAAVKQGRVIFDNIRKVILYLLTDSFSEIILVSGSLFLGLPLPILAIQILWINLVADGLPSIALTLDPAEDGLMKDKPRDRREPILNTEMKILIFIIGVITDFVLFGLFLFLLNFSKDLDYIRTIIYAALGLDSLLYVFSVRTLRHSIFTENPLKNRFLVVAVAVSLVVLVSIIYLPVLRDIFQTVFLGWQEWLIIIGLAIVKVFLIEIVKHHFIVKKRYG